MMQNNMKVIGITGGIGSGKSVLLKVLEEDYSAFVVEADKVAHEIMTPGHQEYEAIVAEFGKEILGEDGFIDRNSLSKRVIGNDMKLAKLNSIVHPGVKNYIKDSINRKRDEGVKLYVIEAALLIQDGYKEICDEIWFVYADRETRIKRLMAGRGYTREKAESFMDVQPDDQFFIDNTDRIIDNNGSIESIKNIDKIFS